MVHAVSERKPVDRGLAEIAVEVDRAVGTGRIERHDPPEGLFQNLDLVGREAVDVLAQPGVRRRRRVRRGTGLRSAAADREPVLNPVEEGPHPVGGPLRAFIGHVAGLGLQVDVGRVASDPLVTRQVDALPAHAADLARAEEFRNVVGPGRMLDHRLVHGRRRRRRGPPRSQGEAGAHPVREGFDLVGAPRRTAGRHVARLYLVVDRLGAVPDALVARKVEALGVHAGDFAGIEEALDVAVPGRSSNRRIVVGGRIGHRVSPREPRARPWNSFTP